jgi:hypothetical protein
MAKLIKVKLSVYRPGEALGVQEVEATRFLDNQHMRVVRLGEANRYVFETSLWKYQNFLPCRRKDSIRPCHRLIIIPSKLFNL